MSDPLDDTYHYTVIHRAIEAIDAAGGAPLPLTQLAAKVNLSPAHFQRVFSRWAGVSPKKLQQYLTLGHAKALLSDRFTTLDVAHSTGLSGTGRLHDLFLRWDAMSPGAFAAGAAGVTIRWGWFDSPFGPALIMVTEKGICGIGFEDERGRKAAGGFDPTLAQSLLYPRPRHCRWLCGPSLSNQRRSSDCAALPDRTPFQIKVWKRCCGFHRVMSRHMQEIAQSVNNPKAVRAVGTAVGRNPISWLVPCHRALRKSGGLGGYHWGLPRKRAMLAWETAHLENADTLKKREENLQ